MLPGPNGVGGEDQRGGAARTAGLHVDDGHARHSQDVQHLVAGSHPPVGGAAEGGLEAPAPQAGLGEARPHGGDTHLGHGPALEPAEWMDPDAGDLDLSHGRAPPARRRR